MPPLDNDLVALDGAPLPAADFEGRALLVVNVASKCGMTPQYEALERLHRKYTAQGLSVLGVPCNQFSGQEPGTPEEIQEFCSTAYQVSFPLTTKLDVNGRRRHPLFERLTEAPDADGVAGEVQWNFEKFVVAPSGEVAARFRPGVDPESDAVIAAIESVIS